MRTITSGPARRLGLAVSLPGALASGEDGVDAIAAAAREQLAVEHSARVTRDRAAGVDVELGALAAELGLGDVARVGEQTLIGESSADTGVLRAND